MKLTFSGTTYFAAFQDIEPEAVTPVLGGCRVTLEVADMATWEAMVDKLSVVAADYADDDHWDPVKAIYKDIERNDVRMGRPRMVEVEVA